MGMHLKYLATWTCENCNKVKKTERDDGMYISKAQKPDGWVWFYRPSGPMGMSGDEYLFCGYGCENEKIRGKKKTNVE